MKRVDNYTDTDEDDAENLFFGEFFFEKDVAQKCNKSIFESAEDGAKGNWYDFVSVN